MPPRDQAYLLGIDIGGTSLRVALARSALRIRKQRKLSSPAQEEPEVMVRTIAETARDLLRELPGASLAAVGLAAPGSIDVFRGMVTTSPNLPRFQDVPLRDLVARELGVPVAMDNDATAAALAEHKLGVGQGTRDMVYVTVSTGIGAGLIVGGRLYYGAHGGAGEAGHMTVQADGPLCSCGRRGCWEALASGTAVIREATRRLQADETGSSLARVLKRRPNGLDVRDVEKAALGGDVMGQAVLDQAAFYLGVGLASLVNLLNPELVVLGGGLTRMGPRFLDPAFKVCRELAFPLHATGLRLEVTGFGDDGPLRGALLLAQELASGLPAKLA
jgi:glucokinase